MAVTSQQIAELAGVSRGTVDRALHNRGRVNPEVAARIRKIAEELGYRPNSIGQALVRARQGLRLGAILQSAETPTMQDVAAGARQAGRGEFTKRAFLNGRLDLAQAEAVMDLIDRDEEGIRVFVGKENPNSAFADSSVIISKYRIGQDNTGAMGLIGPIRMDYARVIPHLE